MQETQHPFIDYLVRLRDHSDQSYGRTALATLRRSGAQPPAAPGSVHAFAIHGVQRWRQEVYFLIAALFARHPEPGGIGNMGAHFAQACGPQTEAEEAAIERRFAVLLAADRADLGFHLHQTVNFLASRPHPVPINWDQLLGDLLNWSHPGGHVQKEWARAFWGRYTPV